MAFGANAGWSKTVVKASIAQSTPVAERWSEGYRRCNAPSTEIRQINSLPRTLLRPYSCRTTGGMIKRNIGGSKLETHHIILLARTDPGGNDQGVAGKVAVGFGTIRVDEGGGGGAGGLPSTVPAARVRNCLSAGS